MGLIPAKWAALALVCVTIGVTPSSRAAEDARIEGTWKLVLIPPLQELEFLVMDVTKEAGVLTPRVQKAQPIFPGTPEIVKLAVDGERVRFSMKIQGAENPFVGTFDKGGDILGTLKLQGNTLPARLEKSADGQIKPFGVDQKLNRAYIDAKSDKDPKMAVEKFAALLVETRDSPMGDVAFSELLTRAGAAGLPEERVRGHVAKWLSVARPFGDAYTSAVQAKIGKALAGQKAYANLALELATEADKSLSPDAATETRAAIAHALADAARNAGKPEIARTADSKAEGLEKALDDEYRKTALPFKPTPYPGRKTNGADRVALVELFTGAECPPCVAADAAFEALIHAHKPGEVIALQYHLHVPGPDPLTNADSVARADYYPQVQGTPAVLLNGKILSDRGGPLSAAKNKFDEYEEAIAKELEGKKSATIDLKAVRTGDAIKITATASTPGAKPDAKLVLRLALIEDEVRYPGGNRVRLHPHVVRAMPGGAAGKAITGGKGQVELTLPISTVRSDLETYLNDHAKANSPFASRPPIRLETLSVAAFVQDDGDKSVLHAVIVPVAEGKP